MNKQAFLTAIMTIGLFALLNQFDSTQDLLNGSNKFFG